MKKRNMLYKAGKCINCEVYAINRLSKYQYLLSHPLLSNGSSEWCYRAKFSENGLNMELFCHRVSRDFSIHCMSGEFPDVESVLNSMN